MRSRNDAWRATVQNPERPGASPAHAEVKMSWRIFLSFAFVQGAMRKAFLITLFALRRKRRRTARSVVQAERRVNRANGIVRLFGSHAHGNFDFRSRDELRIDPGIGKCAEQRSRDARVRCHADADD